MAHIELNGGDEVNLDVRRAGPDEVEVYLSGGYDAEMTLSLQEAQELAAGLLSSVNTPWHPPVYLAHAAHGIDPGF
jgi:hypothetical protein